MSDIGRRIHEDQSGLGLVEILVTIGLLLVVSVPFTQSMVAGMQTQRRQVASISTTSQLQIAMEHVTRDLRGANPLQGPLDPSAVTFDLYRPGGLRPARLAVVPDGTGLQLVLEETVASVTSTRTILRGFQPLPAGETVFTYLDATGAALGPSDPPEDVVRIKVRLRAAVADQPDATLTDSVALRNKES